MGLPKKKNHGTLGRAMIKSRFQGQRAFGVDEGKLVSFVKKKKKKNRHT
jgi:large subunit GTPase 1